MLNRKSCTCCLLISQVMVYVSKDTNKLPPSTLVGQTVWYAAHWFRYTVHWFSVVNYTLVEMLLMILHLGLGIMICWQLQLESSLANIIH